MRKIVFGILVILLIGGIIYSLRKGGEAPGQPVQSPPIATPNSTDKQAIAGIVDNFYKKYDSCMKNPPAEAKGRVGEYCQNNSGFTTANFAANLEKGGTAKAGADPIYCAQNPSENIIVNPDVQIRGDQATVSVNEKFGPNQVTPRLELLKEAGEWKIDNIVCPAP